MKVAIIGGTGHIGSFLTEMLADYGWDVVVVSSGRTPSHTGDLPGRARLVKMNYPGMVADGSFAAMLREEKADAVVDLLQDDTQGVYDAARSAGVGQIVICGSVWMFGRAKVVPTPEVTQTVCEFDGYRARYAEMCRMIAQSKRDCYPLNAVMPPNICGPGKIPLDGMGDRSLELHEAHRRGERVILPFPGTNLVGPCDAEDVARGFFCSLKNPAGAAGEIFNVGSAYALTAEKFIQVYGEIYGISIPIEYVTPEKYLAEVLPDRGANYHFLEHMCPDISKISSHIGYQPRYTPEQTMERAVKWMFDEGLMN